MEKIKYIASSGHTYELHTKDGVWHKRNVYRKWDWDVKGTKQQFGTRIAGFSRAAATYKPELLFFGDNKERLVDALHDDFELDLRNNTAGRIVINGYYLDCFITTSDTLIKNGVITDKIEIYAAYPFWVQETTVNLPVSDVSQSGYLDFPFDFSFDFTAPVVGQKTVRSDFPFASEFRMIIYGLAVNPRVTINGYSYILYATIPQDAYVIVDSRTRSIMQYNSDGTRSNLFDFRNKTDSIFEKVPGGNLNITWDASFGIDLTIYRERSEPRIEVAV